MFEILYLRTFEGDEYKIVGNSKVVHLEWKYPSHDWDLLYFEKLETGIESCFLKLAEEMEFRRPGKDFEINAYQKCKQVQDE